MADNELEEYAKEQINAAAYPEDVHNCIIFRCDTCRMVIPFSVTISYSVACDKNRPSLDFAGTVFGTCSQCGLSIILFSIKRNNQPEEERERPTCSCGSDTYIVCLCERYEGSSGFEGFFDEGVIAGECAVCGTHRTFLFTD